MRCVNITMSNRAQCQYLGKWLGRYREGKWERHAWQMKQTHGWENIVRSRKISFQKVVYQVERRVSWVVE